MTRYPKFFKFPLFILCFGAFLNWMSYGLIYPIFAMMLFDKNPMFLLSASDALRGFWLGVLMASSPIGQLIASPFLGMLSDQIGRKLCLQISYLVIVVGYFLSVLGIWEQSFFLLIFGRIVTGIGAGNISVTNSSVADISHRDEKTKNFALVTMASGLGFTIGPFVGGKLSVWGFDIPFIFAAFLTLIVFFFFTFLFLETYSKQEKEKDDFISGLRRFIQIASFRKCGILFLAFFIFCFGWSFYWEFIPVTWIKIYKLNASQIGNFYAYGSAFYVLSSGLLIRPIINKFKAKPILISAWVGLGICFLLLLHATIGYYWVYIPIQQFLIALIFPVSTTIVSNAVAENRQGESLGVFQSLQSFAFAITPFLGGILLHISYSTPLIVSCITMFLASLILLIAYKTRYV